MSAHLIDLFAQVGGRRMYNGLIPFLHQNLRGCET